MRNRPTPLISWITAALYPLEFVMTLLLDPGLLLLLSLYEQGGVGAPYFKLTTEDRRMAFHGHHVQLQPVTT